MVRLLSSVFTLALAFSFSGEVLASEAAPAKKPPSKYAVYQQAGPVCPFLPWLNLQKIRGMRRGADGQVVMLDEDYSTKIHAYAMFLPRMRTMDKMYDELRAANGPYSQYEAQIRSTGVRKDKRFDAEGRKIEELDADVRDQARRLHASPYNFTSEKYVYRTLPLLLKDGKMAFYNYETKKAQVVPAIETMQDFNSLPFYIPNEDGVFQKDKYQWHQFEPEMLQAMGVTWDDVKFRPTITELAGFDRGFGVGAYKDNSLNSEYFYDVGTFQQMLFACGLKADNTPFTEDDNSLEAAAYREYRQALDKDAQNPWHAINKDDLFEYHLAEIFRTNGELKQKAMQSVGYYNDSWRFYQESLEMYDSADKETRVQLKHKQHLPGEDQMLAYLYSGELRFLWTATISMNAVIDVQELENNLGEDVIEQFRGSPVLNDIIFAAHAKKYNFGQGEFSFLDSWKEIKTALQARGVKKDLVNFSSHGSVISLDPELVKLQNHEHRATAEELGFEMWDSTYDKGLAPFYRKAGTESDIIEF